MKNNEADKWFSLYIRLRDSNESGYGKCVTCNFICWWKSADNGHFVKRQHSGARFHEKNCHLQCRECNWLKQGNDAEYKKFIIETYGQQTHDLLKMAERTATKHSTLEISLIAKEYKAKALKLATEKGLSI